MTTNTIAFWKGEFGNDYCARNAPNLKNVASRTALWSTILSKINHRHPLNRILEVGCNTGVNIRSLKRLTDAELFAVEPNDIARQSVITEGLLDASHIVDGAANKLPFEDNQFDLAFTSGVLIHVPPADLEQSMKEIYRVSKKYIYCSEYFSDQPTEVSYRGHEGVLFKRDFGSLYLDLFPNLQCVDYGFQWKRMTGEDNLTWWLFSK